MRKLLIVFLVFPVFTIAQKTNLFVGLRAPHNIYSELGFQKQDSSRWGVSLGYYIPFFYEMYYYAGGVVPYEYIAQGLNQKGLGIGLSYGLLSKSKKGKWHTFQIEYQYLKSGNYIYDEGKKAGTTMTAYKEFTDKYNNISLIYGIRKEVGRNKRFEVFYEFGLTLRFIQRRYSILGIYSDQYSTNKIENLFEPIPLGRAGINFKIF